MLTVTMSIICDKCGKRTEIDVEPEEKLSDCGCCGSEVLEITRSKIREKLPSDWFCWGPYLHCSACGPVV